MVLDGRIFHTEELCKLVHFQEVVMTFKPIEILNVWNTDHNQQFFGVAFKFSTELNFKILLCFICNEIHIQKWLGT